MGDPLAGLPRLKAEQMTACVGCGEQLLKVFPLFYRLRIQRVGIDGTAISERVGLTAMFGRTRGAAMLAEAFASKDPAVILDDAGEVNVCQSCAQDKLLEFICLVAMAAESEID